ncbi:MAG: pirin [Alteromonadaceae bacterium]|jgi:redox-sensitive bicupin YhaK (pirin superfamily)|uniref:pirin family protein n=1 Tax=Paraglaciecola chathamensis TaxID=368405 RepID=UPI000C440C7B|nr:pirin family protein [Paraglaciecola agarilytica]MBN26693.1 pirin [Alteromonadaceae bacterium]|tara:strand:- start:19099 stop:19983 length:885 start_codon:yes stop_codon:yes gene_type:complete
MSLVRAESNAQKPKISMSPVIAGAPFSVADGFDALSFRHKSFASGFDPLIMVDHYVMTAPTFGAHPHAGLSAVSILFEDSVGKFHNTDSIGNDFDLEPGDLYWLKAASGAVHDERPRSGAKIHGLQMFVNIPNYDKNAMPNTLHVKASDMPIIERDGSRVRLVLGDYLDETSAQSPSTPMNILDGRLNTASEFRFQLQAGFNAWVYAVSGEINLHAGESQLTLQKGESLAIENTDSDSVFNLTNQSSHAAHFVIVSAEPLNESFVQQGPLVASDNETMNAVIAKEQAGLFGSIN